jgi:hypothetical protein
LTFIVRHELWDGNIHDHADQGVSIVVAAQVDGKETALLRFNCFDIEKSYIYGPENPHVQTEGPMMLGAQGPTSSGKGQLYRMDPIADGNPIGWTIRTLETKLPKMLIRAGYPTVAAATDLAEVGRLLPGATAPGHNRRDGALPGSARCPPQRHCHAVHWFWAPAHCGF